MTNINPPNKPDISTARFNQEAVTSVMDDQEAMKIFVELGILDQLTPPNATDRKMYFHFQSDFHWGIAQYFRGYEKKSDNGYAVTLFPKKLFAKEQVAEFLEWMICQDMKQTGSGPPTFVKLGPADKTNN